MLAVPVVFQPDEEGRHQDERAEVRDEGAVPAEEIAPAKRVGQV
jgi:hypothetical protein